MENWLAQSPHRRWNPLKREWVLVSPHRTQRPWQGETAAGVAAEKVRYDPSCYLCPGNTRAGGERTPEYSQTYVFNNDYAALLPDTPPHRTADPLLYAEAERGICRVVIFDPDHRATLADMDVSRIANVVDTWTAQYRELSSLGWVRHVQIFENRGAMMGASNPHPHGQIWATESVPQEAAAEVASLTAYQREHGSCLLCDYVAKETAAQERIVCGNAEFVAVVPWWAVWPFEVLVLPRIHVTSLLAFAEAQQAGLADILKQVTSRYNALFQVSFPYTMGFHQSAPRKDEQEIAHFHAHFYPPLLRSATVRKFMVGFEMLGMPQRDITPELAAARLRGVRVE